MSQENANKARDDFTAMLNIDTGGIFDCMSCLRLEENEARVLATISPQLRGIRMQFNQALHERACKKFCVNATEQLSGRIVEYGHRTQS